MVKLFSPSPLRCLKIDSCVLVYIGWDKYAVATNAANKSSAFVGEIGSNDAIEPKRSSEFLGVSG